VGARAHDKVPRVAGTIADLTGERRISTTHVSEAIQYRRLDRSLCLGSVAEFALDEHVARKERAWPPARPRGSIG
jgi:hypothetical protein